MPTLQKRNRALVSKRALVQRINRALAHQDQQLRATRGTRSGEGFTSDQVELGYYYTVDFRLNCVVEKHVDLEELGRELKVLAAWEKLEE